MVLCFPQKSRPSPGPESIVQHLAQVGHSLYIDPIDEYRLAGQKDVLLKGLDVQIQCRV